MINNKIGDEQYNINYINKIIPLITGDASLLYQLKSFLDSCNRLIDLGYNILKNESFSKQLDNIKFAVASCSVINMAQIKIINNLIDKAKSSSPKNTKRYLDMLINEMTQYINLYTNDYLKKNSLLIIDDNFLPKDKKYIESRDLFEETYDGVMEPEELNKIDDKLSTQDPKTVKDAENEINEKIEQK